jgi:wyosine [tRNA(Phe)-imidazoG37] synthetase (radical SAM superfamily)
MNYIFGPINSRRFGISLGVDLSKEIKQCNFDCLYCELEPAKVVKVQSVSTNYMDIVNELKLALNKYNNLDVITLTANGEPSMYPYLGELIEEINKIKKNTKTLILSNGVAVLEVKTREVLQNIDIVKLSLDAVSPKIFKKINRAEKNININIMIDKMIEFSSNYSGDLIMEILFVKGVNDKLKEVEKISNIIRQINPLRVDISTIDRPPAYKVEKVSNDFLNKAEKYFYGIPTTIARAKNSNFSFEYSKEDIINMLKRRPQSKMDIDSIFSENSRKNILELEKELKIKSINVAGSLFYINQI